MFPLISSTQKEEKRKKRIDTLLLAISDTKATSTMSESRGIAPFGQLAREQQAARASDRRPHRTSPVTRTP